ncbi:NAD-dependent epimerase/dehydratase family protein [Kordiimonas marina]|uniref:NAD-dependent epimerase/dehydratase family protein n=1 Tax=Kordiimonas marina TaxID=2872312 RepID=UPI001FF2FF20|nr:NAD(P)-dependent oxidoreductase [Kordiimonas marina]MCJ9430198.1 NAD(P)-dependent oxidoreductase [Kordiimonas marina]
MSDKNTSQAPAKVIALTGATGFLGGHVIDSLLDAGHEVRALTRRPQEARDGVTWVPGDLSDKIALLELTRDADTLMHVAGLTKALNRDTFFDVNLGGTKLVLEAAAENGVRHVVNVSSLAAREPRLSHYGASKAAAELALSARRWPFSWVNVRPPAIYGPGDKEILKLLKASKLGLLPAPGSSKNRFSMIHAQDLARALTILAEGGHGTATYEIDDMKPSGYQLKDVAEALGSKEDRRPRILPVPFPVLGTLGAINGLFASMIRRPAMLTLPTARYLCHNDWTVRSARRPILANWSPQFDLKTGLKDTMDWYRKNGLL